MGAASEHGEPDESKSWPRSSSELDTVFGQVGARFNAQWKALGGPPFQSVREADLDGLYNPHWKAEELRDQVQAALLARGLNAGDFPELCGKVDARGRPVVVLGAVNAATVGRLCAALLEPRIPPAADGTGNVA